MNPLRILSGKPDRPDILSVILKFAGTPADFAYREDLFNHINTNPRMCVARPIIFCDAQGISPHDADYDDCVDSPPTGDYLRVVLRFQTPQDAVAFKLRWA